MERTDGKDAHTAAAWTADPKTEGSRAPPPPPRKSPAALHLASRSSLCSAVAVFPKHALHSRAATQCQLPWAVLPVTLKVFLPHLRRTVVLTGPVQNPGLPAALDPMSRDMTCLYLLASPSPCLGSPISLIPHTYTSHLSCYVIIATLYRDQLSFQGQY